MQVVPGWVQTLGFSTTDFEQWQSQCPLDISVLVYAIEKGFLNEDQYLAWAQTQFSLPIVHPSFFAQPAPLDLWQRAQNFAKETLVIASWDGIIFVACLEPPLGAETIPATKFVLAPWSEIRKWMAFKNTPLTKVAESTSSSISGLSFGSLLSEANSVVMPPLPTPALVAKASAEPLSQLNFSLNNDTPASAQSLATPIEGTSVNFSLVAPEEITSMNRSGYRIDPDTNTQTHTNIQHQEDGLVVLRGGRVIGELSSVKTMDDIPFYTLAKLRKTYDKVMILVFGGDKVIPWKWDETWQFYGADVGQLELNSPSMFKFVADTKVSYHGYTVHSPTNDQFFREWNHGNIPEHITICPVTAMGTLTGMVLGICSRVEGQKIKLSEVESIAQETSELFIKMTMAAAG